MKNKILFGAGLSACCMAWAAKDPVVMNVNGVDVHRSEFEYLFHKNNQQQLVPQSLDDYKELFEIYKLKVADAKAAGLDTLASFRKEMNQYRKELAAPYLTDSVFIEHLVKEFADRAKEDVQARHIMLFKDRSGVNNAKIRSRLDSIRNLLMNGADFEALAVEYSEDPSVGRNKGNLGFIKPGRYPYDFETAVYSLKDGEVSEIVESPQAFHVLKGGARRPARGKVEVSHILLLSNENDDEKSREMTKQKIDSIYQEAVAHPEQFADLAHRFSQDPGSARQGGHLPPFGSGEMVPEFENESYNLREGEIGMPFKTSYGWHIVKKHKDIPVDPENDARMDVNRSLSNPQSEKSRIVRKHLTERLAAKHKGKIISSSLDEMIAKAQENGMDSVFFNYFRSGRKGEMPLLTINGKKYTVGEFLEGASGAMNLPPEAAESVLRNAADNFFSMKLMEEEQDWLYSNEPDYRNLLNEYHDGTLLYEVSLEKVWDKASSDTKGLEAYFNTHRQDYTWTKPRVKGWLVQAANDSVAQIIKTTLGVEPIDSVMALSKGSLAGQFVMEKILTAKGANPVVDYLYYGTEAPGNAGKFPVAFLYDAREVAAPEEVADVRGQVVSDYQNLLEKEWVEHLRTLYPVKWNKKELKKVK